MHLWFNSYGHFSERLDFAYWWSCNRNGLCLQPGQQACFYSNKINTHELNDPNLSVQVLARQFIGSPINCMSDSMSGGIMDSYCWLHSTYSVNGRFGFNRSIHLGIHKQTNVGWSLDSLAHSGASHSHTMYVFSSDVKHCNSKLTSLLPARNTLHAITFTKPPLFQRNRLACSGNPTYESCVEVKAEQR